MIAQRSLDSPDWFLDWAYEQTIALLEEQRLLSDFVIEVKTTVDVKLQAAAQKILNDVIDTEGPGYRFTPSGVSDHDARRRGQGHRGRPQL